jgi:hypothetical protein
MNIIELHLDHFDFFCPVTGIQLLGDGQQDQSPALLGIWNQEVIDEPEIYHEPLKKKWKQWLEKQEDHLGLESGIDDFLAAIAEDNWLAFQLDTGGGLMPETVTLVIDMNYCPPTKEENDTEEDEEPDNPEKTTLLPKEIDRRGKRDRRSGDHAGVVSAHATHQLLSKSINDMKNTPQQTAEAVCKILSDRYQQTGFEFGHSDPNNFFTDYHDGGLPHEPAQTFAPVWFQEGELIHLLTAQPYYWDATRGDLVGPEGDNDETTYFNFLFIHEDGSVSLVNESTGRTHKVLEQPSVEEIVAYAERLFEAGRKHQAADGGSAPKA